MKIRFANDYKWIELWDFPTARFQSWRVSKFHEFKVLDKCWHAVAEVLSGKMARWKSCNFEGEFYSTVVHQSCSERIPKSFILTLDCSAKPMDHKIVTSGHRWCPWRWKHHLARGAFSRIADAHALAFSPSGAGPNTSPWTKVVGSQEKLGPTTAHSSPQQPTADHARRGFVGPHVWGGRRFQGPRQTQWSAWCFEEILWLTHSRAFLVSE